MGLLDLLALSVAIGVDTLSVSIGIGFAGPSKRRIVQFGSAFAMTAAALLGVGYTMATGLRHVLALLGHRFEFNMLNGVPPDVVHSRVHLVLSLLSAAILCGIGLQLLRTKKQDGDRPFAVRGLWGLLWLATLVSLDAISAGLSLGMIEGTQAAQAIVVVGLVNGGMSFFGLGVGSRLGTIFNSNLRRVGGLILIGVALKLIWNILG